MPASTAEKIRPPVRTGIEITVEAFQRLARSSKPDDRHFAGELGAYLDVAAPGWRTR
jgi:hypothetical protein